MNTKPSLPELISYLRERFASGVPNGFSLGWDGKRLHNQLTAAAQPLNVVNYTAFDYAFCNHYQVRLDGNIESTYDVLTVRISFLSDFYCLHWTRYERGGRTGTVVSSPRGLQASEMERKIQKMLEGEGLEKIPDEWLDEAVPGVSLELSGSEGVTVSKCLFEDYNGAPTP